jgi:hypothetical protein
LDNGRCPTLEFLNEIEPIREGPKSKPDSSAKARFLFLFQQMADYGRVSSKRFYKEMGELWTFAHEVRNLQIRFPCFRDGNKWIVTHGFIKPGAQKGLGKWPDSEVRRAEEIMAHYRRQCAKCRTGGKS